ncbi:MAG: hypothetical protein IID44_19115 [Planctomycetes bacterium]|nr:hypothetical protein [Planctomycetota bacterium]
MMQCYKCSEPISGVPVPLWDGHDYCEQCVGDADPELVAYARSHDVIAETLERHLVRFTKILVFVVLFVLAVTMLCLVPTGWLFVVLDWLPLMLTATCVVAFSAILSTVMFLFFWSEGVSHRESFPRTVSVQGGQVAVKSHETVESCPLSECRWYEGNSQEDQINWYLPKRQAILFDTPIGIFAIGWTAEAYGFWKAFLTVAQIPHIARPGNLWFRLFLGTMLGSVIGAAVGAACGAAGLILSGDTQWMFVFTVLGAFNGLSVGGLYASWLIVPFYMIRDLKPIWFSSTFCFIGFTIARVLGLEIAIAVGIGNAILGWLFMRDILRRYHANRTGIES